MSTVLHLQLFFDFLQWALTAMAELDDAFLDFLNEVEEVQQEVPELEI